jgi:disulfide oxidoreductase YuzD
MNRNEKLRRQRAEREAARASHEHDDIDYIVEVHVVTEEELVARGYPTKKEFYRLAREEGLLIGDETGYFEGESNEE